MRYKRSAALFISQGPRQLRRNSFYSQGQGYGRKLQQTDGDTHRHIARATLFGHVKFTDVTVDVFGRLTCQVISLFAWQMNRRAAEATAAAENQTRV